LHNNEKQRKHSQNNSKSSYTFPSLLLSNVRSLLNKVDELDSVANCNGCDMIVLTETWANENMDDATSCIGCFDIVRKGRAGKRGGGVMIYVKNSLAYKVLDNLNKSEHESVWIIFRGKRMPREVSHIAVCAVYHPLQGKSNDLNRYLSQCIDTILSKHPFLWPPNLW